MLQQNIYAKSSSTLDASGLTLDEFLEVGSYGNFVSFNHTKQLCCEAFYKPLFLDGFNNETWYDDDDIGHMSAQKHRNTVLNEYVAPPKNSGTRRPHRFLTTMPKFY